MRGGGEAARLIDCDVVSKARFPAAAVVFRLERLLTRPSEGFPGWNMGEFPDITGGFLAKLCSRSQSDVEALCPSPYPSQKFPFSDAHSAITVSFPPPV